MQIFSECYGRGPTKAKSYQFDDYVVSVLEDIFTTVEQTLVKNGEQDLVRKVRLTFQEAVADRFTGAVSRGHWAARWSPTTARWSSTRRRASRSSSSSPRTN